MFSLQIACAFFFQAEDGIRARNVTGVQTCALPILDRTRISFRSGNRGAEKRFSVFVQLARRKKSRGHSSLSQQRFEIAPRFHRLVGEALRSEERRVGKEWRSRGWRDV